MSDALLIRFEDEPWLRDARCVGLPPELFHPADGVGVEQAKAVCHKCPVRLACLTYAIEHHEDYGVWGGASERTRKRIATKVRRGMTVAEAEIALGVGPYGGARPRKKKTRVTPDTKVPPTS